MRRRTPTLRCGGLGCGVVVDLASDGQYAALVDCELAEVERLTVVAVERETI